MALIGNRSILHNSPGRFLSGTAGTLRSGFNKPGMLAGRFEQMSLVFAALPSGNLSPSAWSLPRSAGGGASRNNAVARVSATGSIAGGITTTGTASFTLAFLDAVVFPLDDTPQAPAGLASFSFSAAGVGGLVVSSAGTAAFSFSATGTPTGVLNGSGAASFSVTGTLAPYAVGHMLGTAAFVFSGSADALPLDDTPRNPSGAANFSFSGSLVPYAIGHMTGTTDVAAELTADAVANAVWGYNVDTGVTAQQAIQLLLAAGGSLTVEQATRLQELWQMAGLDPAAPVTATKTRRYAGDSVTPEIDQTITGNGRTTSTITRT